MPSGEAASWRATATDSAPVSKGFPNQLEVVMPGLQKLRVLVAHDDPLLAAGIAATVSARAGFEVVKPDGIPGSSLAELSRFADVVVADYDSALKLMAASDGRGRVLVLTHEDSEAHVRLAMERGVRGYLMVGCAADDFLEALRVVSRGGTVLAQAAMYRIADSLTSRPLTPRELSVLRVLMGGLSNKAIAKKLAVSEGTIKSHVKAIMSKLNASGRTQAVAIAQRRGIWRANDIPGQGYRVPGDLLRRKAFSASSIRRAARTHGESQEQVSVEKS